MDENNEKPTELPSESLQSAIEGQPEFREISKEELKVILEDHQKWIQSRGKEGEKASFYRTDLAGVDLQDSNLQGANFIDANLEGTNFINANLKEANFSRANLKNAILRAADLEGALLSYTNLQEASLQDAGLQEADLNNADLKRANLFSANLQRANFTGAHLKETILSNINIDKANLFKADFNSAGLAGVKGLPSANIRYANFEGVTGLLGIEFARNDLTGTKLPEKIDEFKTLHVVEETSKKRTQNVLCHAARLCLLLADYRNNNRYGSAYKYFIFTASHNRDRDSNCLFLLVCTICFDRTFLLLSSIPAAFMGGISNPSC